jgi:mono/diheme cytochrome c family protein
MRVLKWAGFGLAGLVVLAVCAAGGALAASELMIRWPVQAPRATFISASAGGSVERGERIAKLAGCHECHGAGLQGRLFHDDPAILQAFAPNLTLAAAAQSDAELDRAIRHGVAADGRRLWIMPSSAFAQFSDQETADLIAYVRSLPKGGQVQPHLKVGPLGRAGVLLHKVRSEPELIAAEPARLPDLGARHAEGRRLARFCVECHGPTLSGSEMVGSPDLTVAAAYAPADFARLLRTGRAAGDRELGLMSTSARARFSGLSDAEIAALHGYLKARAERVIAAAQ